MNQSLTLRVTLRVLTGRVTGQTSEITNVYAGPDGFTGLTPGKGLPAPLPPPDLALALNLNLPERPRTPSDAYGRPRTLMIGKRGRARSSDLISTSPSPRNL